MRPLIERVVRELAALERPSASDGERRAADLAGRRAARRGLPRGAGGGGARPRRLLVAARAAQRRRAAGRRARPPDRRPGGRARGGRASTTTCRAGGCWFRRRALPHRPTYNVVAEAGDPRAERTVVFVAHHDAAHSGLVFHPALPRARDGAHAEAARQGRAERPDHLRRVPRPAAAGALGPDRPAAAAGARRLLRRRRHRHDGRHRPQRGGPGRQRQPQRRGGDRGAGALAGREPAGRACG